MKRPDRVIDASRPVGPQLDGAAGDPPPVELHRLVRAEREAVVVTRESRRGVRYVVLQVEKGGRAKRLELRLGEALALAAVFERAAR